MTDRIVISGLRCRGHHGVLAAERELGQVFVVDVVLEVDLAAAGSSDDIADTVNYAELVERLAAIVAGKPVRLIEALATRLAQACLADRRVGTVEVTVHKPAAPVAAAVADIAVTVVRSRR
jgi:dihydroneopterin aldolase